MIAPNQESHFNQHPFQSRRSSRSLLLAILIILLSGSVQYGQTGTAGVWRPGNGGQLTQRALSWNDFKTAEPDLL